MASTPFRKGATVGVFKSIAKAMYNAYKSVIEGFIAMMKTFIEWLSSLGGAREKSVASAFLVLLVGVIALFALLRSCAEDTNDAAPVTIAEMSTTTEMSTTSTTIVPSTTTSTAPLPTTTVAVAKPVSTPVKTTTTVKAPTRSTTTSTVAPATTEATTTTVATTTTTIPPTTTTIAPRTVTFSFVEQEWSDTQKTSTVTDIASLTSTEATWVKALPNGSTRFTFRMYLYRNSHYLHPTRLADVVGATCVDDNVQNNSYSSISPSFAPDTSLFVTVTCDATGTGPISIPLTFELAGTVG